MAAVSAIKSLFTADRFLTSIPSILNTRHPHHILPFAPSVRVFSLKAQFPLVSLKEKRKISVDARITEWAQAEQVEEEEEDFDFGEEGPESRISDFEGENEGDHEVGESEGEGAFEEEDTYQEPPEDAKLFVGNLPYDVDSEQLAQMFDKVGIVEVAEVIYNRETDRSRGFGFVTMSTVEEAEKAVEMFHRYDLNGRFLTVNKSSPRGSRTERAPREFGPSFRVYVGNLPWQVDDARLEQVFSDHGKVVDARVVCDRETGRSRGFGFVTLSSKGEVDDAIAALDGQILDGRALRVNAAEEKPRRNSF